MNVKIQTKNQAAQAVADLLKPLDISGRVSHCIDRTEKALKDAGYNFDPAYEETDAIRVYTNSGPIEIEWIGSQQGCRITD